MGSGIVMESWWGRAEIGCCGLWPSSGPGMCGGCWGIALPLWQSALLGILFWDFDTLNIYCDEFTLHSSNKFLCYTAFSSHKSNKNNPEYCVKCAIEGPSWGSKLRDQVEGPRWGSKLRVQVEGPSWGTILRDHIEGPNWGIKLRDQVWGSKLRVQAIYSTICSLWL